jgi:hypothetical protein
MYSSISLKSATICWTSECGLPRKILKVPWTPTVTLPKDMAKLPAGQNFRRCQKGCSAAGSLGRRHTGFLQRCPSGADSAQRSAGLFENSGNTPLYIANTDSDIFLDDAQQQFYILLSGRWFSSKALGGPWSYAGNSLPADFSKIPSDSAKSGVLASVPGTVEASTATAAGIQSISRLQTAGAAESVERCAEQAQ